MNNNSKLIVLVAVAAIGAIVLVFTMFGGNKEEGPTTSQPPVTNNTTPSQPPASDKYKAELEQLEAQVKGNPTDAKYFDVYTRIAQIYFDIGMENRFTGNLNDCQVPFDKAISNYKAASKIKDSAEAHAGIAAAIYSTQAVASYFGPTDAKQIALAEEELKTAVKIDPKSQQALFWYAKYALKFKQDVKLAEKYVKQLETQKIDPALSKEIEGLKTAIKEGNTTSHSSASGDKNAPSGDKNAPSGGTAPGGSTSGGELPSGHPSIK